MKISLGLWFKKTCWSWWWEYHEWDEPVRFQHFLIWLKNDVLPRFHRIRPCGTACTLRGILVEWLWFGSSIELGGHGGGWECE